MDVLLGKETDKILQFNHHHLPVFGVLGTELDSKEWQSVFRQLIAAGHVIADADRFGGLCADRKVQAFAARVKN